MGIAFKIKPIRVEKFKRMPKLYIQLHKHRIRKAIIYIMNSVNSRIKVNFRSIYKEGVLSRLFDNNNSMGILKKLLFTGKQAQPAERSEGSCIIADKILRCAQDDIAVLR